MQLDVHESGCPQLSSLLLLLHSLAKKIRLLFAKWLHLFTKVVGEQTSDKFVLLHIYHSVHAGQQAFDRYVWDIVTESAI